MRFRKEKDLTESETLGEDELNGKKRIRTQTNFFTIFLSLGLIYGLKTENLALGIGLGVAIGVVADQYYMRKNKRELK